VGRQIVLFALMSLCLLNAAAEIQLWRNLEQAEQSDPAERGYLMLQHGHIDAAARDFHRALEIDPGNTPALNGLGLVEWNQRDLTQAEAHFRQAIALSPDDPQGRVNLADLLFERGKFADCIEHYQVAERGDSGSVYIQLRLVSAYRKLGNFEAAIKHCRKALAIAPRDREVRRRYESLERELAGQKPARK
jgi:tetratricopeptide (TPR) repeat protein